MIEYFKSYKIKKDTYIYCEYQKEQIKSSKELSNIFRQIYKELNYDLTVNEVFIMLAFDYSYNIKGTYVLSSGGITSTLCDLRLAGKFLFDTLATNFALCHNHPSGRLEFSNSDKDMMEKFKKSFDLFDIKLIDSIVLTEDSYISAVDMRYF